MKSKLLFALAASFAALGCATSGIVGSGEQRAIAPQVAEQAARQHPQIVQEFGGEVGGGVSNYVAEVGRRIGAESGLRGGGTGVYAFTALNSPVANAFAVPGGRVYVTRQLLALMNSEAELAFVLGHEAGHIAADHSAGRQNRSLWAQLGALVLGAVTGSGELAQLAGGLGQQVILSYSRGQEFDADRLGIRYMAAAGYDPLAAAGILATLGAYGDMQARFSGREDDQRATPSWGRTHPLSSDRVERALAEARSAPAAGQRDAGRDRFLAAIDGMIYDDDPAQGVVEGRDFRHPDLRVAFTAPEGYGIQNGTRAVGVIGTDGQAQFSTAPYAGDLDAFVGRVFQALGGQGRIAHSRPQRTTINGLPAAVSTARVQTQGGVLDVAVVAYEFSQSQGFYFLTVARAGAGLGPFAGMVQSVRRLSAQEAAAIRPRVIDVVTAGPGDSVRSLAARMAYATYQEDRFRVLNGLAAGDSVRPGQRVKLVVWGRRG